MKNPDEINFKLNIGTPKHENTPSKPKVVYNADFLKDLSWVVTILNKDRQEYLDITLGNYENDRFADNCESYVGSNGKMVLYKELKTFATYLHSFIMNHWDRDILNYCS